MLYLGFRWLHFVAVISWMAGILYLYRLLIYQAERGGSPESSELLTLMARRLYRYITRPAMIVSFVGGLGMLSQRPEVARTGPPAMSAAPFFDPPGNAIFCRRTSGYRNRNYHAARASCRAIERLLRRRAIVVDADQTIPAQGLRETPLPQRNQRCRNSSIPKAVPTSFQIHPVPVPQRRGGFFFDARRMD